MLVPVCRRFVGTEDVAYYVEFRCLKQLNT